MTRTSEQAHAAYQVDVDLADARSRLGAAMPDGGWLWRYLQAVTPLTDTPVEFSLASGLCALSAALGNSLWFETWGQRVYPHLWAVLVAPSSFWRKSTAINLAERILREAEDARVLPSDFSREKLLEELQARPVGLLTLKEFGGFLATIGRDYMAGTKEMLTELYDGPDRYTRALKAKSYVVERPALTLLAATTLDWLESRITDGDLRGGFLGRFLFVTAARKSSAKGLTGGMDAAARMDLRDGLIELTRVTVGPARLDPDAKVIYEAWMGTWEEEVTSSHHSADLTGFAVRLQVYALKVAMLHQASTSLDAGEPVDVVSRLSIERAIAYCRLLWGNVASLIDDEIAIGKDAKDIRRIKGMVGAGIDRSALLRLSKMRARDFDQLLDTLVQSGDVIRERRKASEVGLERARDRDLEWVRPGLFGGRVPAYRSGGPEANGSYSSLTVPVNSNGPENGNPMGEAYGAFSSVEDPYSYSSSLSLSDEKTRGRVEGYRGEPGNGTVSPEWSPDDVADALADDGRDGPSAPRPEVVDRVDGDAGDELDFG